MGHRYGATQKVPHFPSESAPHFDRNDCPTSIGISAPLRPESATAFREIVEFDLKKPLSRDLFERMWDRLYANGLNLSGGHGDIHQEIHQ